MIIYQNLTVFILCESTNSYPYNIVTIMTLGYLAKKTVIFDFLAQSEHL